MIYNRRATSGIYQRRFQLCFILAHINVHYLAFGSGITWLLIPASESSLAKEMYETLQQEGEDSFPKNIGAAATKPLSSVLWLPKVV